MKKILVVLALVCSLVVGTQSKTDASSVSMLESINGQRALHGLAALTVDTQLEGLATDWSQTMADQGNIFHSDLTSGVTENWKKLGENVGTGGSLDSIAAAFIASPAHLANIIDPDFQAVGIGIIKGGSNYYVTEKFVQLFGDPVVAKPVPTKTTAPIATIPPTTIVVIPPATTTTPVTTTTIEPLPVNVPTPKVVSPPQKGFLKMFKQLLYSFMNLVRLKKPL